ncbi:site-specific integrase [Enterococcus sp. DIV0212c]|uniref:tyrosine-type recombinase/integrase n=1 Tax=Enterococcus sp. DIV0212c TaxID=2230867 RepID=UPI001A9C1747|nr:site-specific integrase [Enterococcus sp. DIV0212c]
MARGENIYKRKDGRWEGRYPKGRRADGSLLYGYIYSSSYKIVREQIIEKKAQWQLIHKPVPYYFSGTFGDWVDIWLNKLMKGRLKPSTYTSYSNKFQVHILPYLGRLSLEKITAANIDQLIQEISKELRPSSVHVVFRLLKSCIYAAKERGYIYINPCEQTILPRYKKTKVRALTRQEQQAVEVESLKSYKGLPILLALETGMRIGEICALKWSDINFSSSTLQVRRTKQRVNNTYANDSRTCLIETEPKTMAGDRIIPLSKKLKKLLIAELDRTNSAYVISNGIHSVEPRTLNYRFEKIKREIGLQQVSFHSLRHTFATRCVELGANIASISALLGHTSIKLTLDTYASSFFEEQQATIKKLEQL